MHHKLQELQYRLSFHIQSLLRASFPWVFKLEGGGGLWRTLFRTSMAILIKLEIIWQSSLSFFFHFLLCTLGRVEEDVFGKEYFLYACEKDEKKKNDPLIMSNRTRPLWKESSSLICKRYYLRILRCTKPLQFEFIKFKLLHGH